MTTATTNACFYLETSRMLADGRVLWPRPVLPEDEPALQRTFGKLTPDEIYLRFCAPLKALSHAMATRFTQIDHDRQMVLILTEHGAIDGSAVAKHP